MEYSAAFGNVDLLATEHRVDTLPKARFHCQLKEKLKRLIRDPILRVIQKNSRGTGGQTLPATGVICKEIAQMFLNHTLMVNRESLPGFAVSER